MWRGKEGRRWDGTGGGVENGDFLPEEKDSIPGRCQKREGGVFGGKGANKKKFPKRISDKSGNEGGSHGGEKTK